MCKRINRKQIYVAFCILVIAGFILYKNVTTFGKLYFLLNKHKLELSIKEILNNEIVSKESDDIWKPINGGLQPYKEYQLSDFKQGLQSVAYYSKCYGKDAYSVFFPTPKFLPLPADFGYLYVSNGDVGELNLIKGRGTKNRIDNNWFEVVTEW